jgi:alpha-2,8-polysialyltransferase (POLYST)
MKNVFLVKTPLQLLNAMEAKYFFNLDKKQCVLIIMGDRKSQHQLLMLSEAVDEWEDVIVLNNVCLFFGNPFNKCNSFWFKCFGRINFFNKSIFNIRRLNKISRYIGDVDYIFLGYVKYVFMRHFANITPHKKIYLLDDGSATLIVANQRNQGITVDSDIGFKGWLKLFVKKFFQGIKSQDLKHYNYFTMYDIDSSADDLIVRNDYRYLRSSSELLPVTSDIYFIGGPLSEVGMLSQDSYFDHLRRVQKFYSGKKIIYVAHRRESKDKLDKIKTELDFEVKLFDYPIEYQLAFVGPRPEIVASFVSTALDSCRIIFSKKIKLVSFKLESQNGSRRKQLKLMYKSYESHVGEYFTVVSNY